MLATFVSLLCAAGPVPLDSGWQARAGDRSVVGGQLVDAPPDAEWKDFPIPGWVPRSIRDDAAHVWLRVHLPATLPRGAALKLDLVVGSFEVYVGTTRVAQFPPGIGLEATGQHGTPWHLIELPDDAAGQWLLLRTRTEYPLAGFQGVPLVGTREELIVDVVRRDLPRFVLGALLLLIGALGLLLVNGPSGPLARSLAPYALAGGTYVLFYTQLKQLVLPLTPALWFALWPISVAVLGAAWLHFLSAALETPSRWLERFRRVVTALSGLTIVDTLVSWALLELAPGLERAVVLTFFGVGAVLRVAMLASATWSLGWLVQLARGRGDTADRRRAIVLLVGVSVLLVATWLNALAALALGPQAAGTGVPLGLLGLTLALVVLVQRAWGDARDRAVASEERLAARAKEKEAMLRDLHDGIGSVTTNIRLLAELGRADASRSARALDTIAELSTEGLAELRAFTQTLEDDEVTWPVLVAELRRFGGQVIEAHGMTFELEATVAADASPPTGVVTLALLRIFREAITNVVKHAAAQRVDVSLVVTPGALTLSLRDDGAGGGGGGGLDTGRGLHNMRARATELGGQVEVQAHPSRRLEVRLPLAVRAA
ncbi:MAG: histidine kinase [Myxococcaceae bacterium]|nr:histidine kinase [Myxococcaceae bacterium]